MNKFQNEGVIDRLVRLFLAELLLVGGYYWLGGAGQIAVIILGVAMLLTSAVGFCGVYKLIGLDTKKMYPNNPSKILLSLFALVLIVLPVAGSYYSNFFTKKIFVEDFNHMNAYYKQVLFNTGQDKRAESVDNYTKLVAEFSAFQAKYKTFKPVIIRGDQKFDVDLVGVANSIAAAKDKIATGDLKATHFELESIRLTFQDILKRNNFSMIGMALVDFHDAMEVVIEAGDKKDGPAVVAAYNDAKDKLAVVEAIENDAEIQDLHAKLNTMIDMVYKNQLDELPKKGAELKSSFIKVYLKRN